MSFITFQEMAFHLAAPFKEEIKPFLDEFLSRIPKKRVKTIGSKEIRFHRKKKPKVTLRKPSPSIVGFNA